MAKKPKKTERDQLSEGCKMLTKLLMHEATNGIIPLPKGVEAYTPPPIPFAERRALLDSVSKGLIIDMKVNPESEPSVFESMKEDLNERNRKRDSAKNGSGGTASTNGGAYPPDDADDVFDTFPN